MIFIVLILLFKKISVRYADRNRRQRWRWQTGLRGIRATHDSTARGGGKLREQNENVKICSKNHIYIQNS